jgi:hypothetical protein
MFLGIDTIIVNPLTGWTLLGVILILIWKLAWTGFALYRAIQLQQKKWFVALFITSFVLNELGIIGMIYLLLNKDKNIRKFSTKRKVVRKKVSKKKVRRKKK